MQLLSIKRIAILGLIFSLHIFAIKPLVAGSVDKMSVPIAPEVTITVDDMYGATDDNTICQGSQVMLTAAGGDIYSWSTGDDEPSIKVGSGNYMVTVTDENNCTGTASVEIREYELPEVMITVDDIFGATDDNTICQGSQVMLTATGGDTYSWSTGDDEPSIKVGSGNYMVTVTDENNCTETASLEIREYEAPEVTITVNDNFGNPNDRRICPQATTEIIGEGGNTYSWSTNINANSINVGVGDYAVTATDGNGCTGTASVIIEEYDAPDISIGVDDNFGNPNDRRICPQATTEIFGIGGNTYSWSTNVNANSINVGVGDYAVTATDGNGCTGTASVEIREYDSPDASFTIDGQIPIQVTTPLDYNAIIQGYPSYSWNFGEDENCFTIDNVDNINSSSIRMQYNCGGTQMPKLIVTDDNNCTNSSSQNVNISSGVITVFIRSIDTLCVGAETAALAEVTETSGNGWRDANWELVSGPDGANIDDIITDGASTLEPTFKFDIDGEYKVSISVTQNVANNPLMANDTVYINVRPNPSRQSSLSLPKDDIIICQNEELEIDINLVDGDFSNYIFRIRNVDPLGVEDSVDIVVNNNSSNIRAETDSLGEYTYSILSIVDGNGCRVDDLDQSVSYKVESNPTIENVEVRCISETEFVVEFDIENGQDSFNIMQTVNGVQSSIPLSDTIFESSPLQLAVYGTEWAFFVEDANGCQSTSEDGTTDDCSDLCFSFNENIEPTLSDTDRMLCAGESIKASIDLSNNQLREGQGLRFVLVNEIDENTQETVDTSQLMFDSGDDILEYVFDNIETGNYFVQVQAGSVDDMDAFTDEVCGIETEDSDVFTVFPFPDIEAITVNTMCANDRETVIDIDLVEPLVGNYTIYFSNGDEELINNNTIEIETPVDDTPYTIDSLVYENGNFSCTSSNLDLNIAEFELDVFPLPVIEEINFIDEDGSMVIGISEDVQFVAKISGSSNGINDYSWSFNAGSSISTGTNSVIDTNFIDPGDYNLELEVEDENECINHEIFNFEVRGGLMCNAITITAERETVCFGETIMISSNIIEVDDGEIGTYSWSINGVEQADNTSNNFEYTPEINPETGTIADEISVLFTNILDDPDNPEVVCISNESSITIEVNATPEFGGNGFKVSNESLCLNQLSTYILDLEREADEYVWTVLAIDTVTDIPIANIGWPTVGTFELGVVAQNENGCNAETTIDIEVGSTEAPPYYDLFTIDRNDTESIIVAYPDSTFCYEWHSSETQTDFINNFGNNDITFSNLEEDQRQFKVFNSPSEVPEFTWIKVYGDGNEACDGSINDDCATEIFYNGSVPTFFAPRYANPDIVNPEIILYPNPNNGQFIIEFQGEFEKADYHLSVFDSRGALLLNKTLVEDDISQSKYEVQFNDLVSGLYYIRITSVNGEGQTKNFVIQK